MEMKEYSESILYVYQIINKLNKIICQENITVLNAYAHNNSFKIETQVGRSKDTGILEHF